MTPRAVLAALALALALAWAAAAPAQTGTAPLAGVVVEAGTGRPVAGAAVEAGGASATTGADGAWSLASAPGDAEARVRVTHPGYAPASATVRRGASALVSLTPRPVALDALVVTAARRTQRLADAAAATELVDAGEIERSGASDLAGALAGRMGIQAEGGHPSGAGVMLQGLDAERVLILVDGKPLVGRLSGTLDVSRIPVAGVERVEIVKGPQSTLYGSEAMGGVVNVVTRAPEAGTPLTLSSRATGGSQGRVDAAGEAAGALGPVAFALRGGRRGVDLAPGRDDERGAASERWDGGARFRWDAGGTEMEASASLLDERQQWQSGQLHQFADNREWTARLATASTAGPIRISSSLYTTAFEHLSRRGTSPTPPAGGERETQRLAEGEVIAAVTVGSVDVDGGLLVRRDAVSSPRVTEDRRVLYTGEAFAQATWRAGRLQVVPGARVSRSERWGTHATPRLAVLFRPVPAVALRGSVGQGYRAPGFKELYMDFLNATPQLTYAVRGNAGLRPETSRNVTVGAEWAGARTFLRGQLFHTSFRDFIETRPAGDSAGVTVYTYGNVGRGLTRGAELEGGAAWGGLRADASYAYLEAESEDGAALLGRAPHTGRLALSYARAAGLRAALTGTWTSSAVAARDDETGAETEREAWLRWDARLAHRLPRGLEAAVGVDNLLAARPAGWPGATGRHLYVTVGWTLGASRPSPASLHTTDGPDR